MQEMRWRRMVETTWPDSVAMFEMLAGAERSTGRRTMEFWTAAGIRCHIVRRDLLRTVVRVLQWHAG